MDIQELLGGGRTPALLEKSALAPNADGRLSQLRTVLAGDAPGMWASQHLAELERISDWNYIAIHALGLQWSNAAVHCFIDKPTAARKLERQKQRNLPPDQRLELLRKRAESIIHRRRLKSFDGRERETDAQDKVPLRKSHWLVELCRRPNPNQSGAQFRFQVAQQLGATGSTLIWTVRDTRGRPREQYAIPTGIAWCEPPSEQFPRGSYYITPQPAYAGRLGHQPLWQPGTFGYLMAFGGHIDFDAVRPVRWPHPLYLTDGLSPLSAGSTILDVAYQIETAIFSRFNNQARPGLIFELLFPDMFTKFGEPDMKAFREKLEARNAGTANTGRDLFVPIGLGAKTLEQTAVEMDMMNARGMARDAVFSLHHMPGIMAGSSTANSYSELYAAAQQFVEFKIQPNLNLYAEEQALELCPRGSGLIIEVKAAAINDPTLAKERLDRLETRCLVIVDEARALEGMGPHPDPEYGKVPANTTYDSFINTRLKLQEAKQQEEQRKQAASTMQQSMALGGGAQPPTAHGDTTPTETDSGQRVPVKDAAPGRADALAGGKGAPVIKSLTGEAPRVHDSAIALVDLPNHIALAVKQFGRTIRSLDLAPEGLEEQPHITVVHGILGTREDLIELLRNFGPLRATLGKTSIFENGEHDVVKFDVQSDDLQRLNSLIKQHIAHKEDKWPNYMPHVTVAYVKPGLGQYYSGFAGLEGRVIEFDSVVFSDRQRARTVIPVTKARGELIEKGFDPKPDLKKAGETIKNSGLPMPGYGQIFLKKSGSGEVWYVGGDGDENGTHDLVNRELMAIEGIDEVTYEAESFPPRDGSWMQVYPEERDWTKKAFEPNQFRRRFKSFSDTGRPFTIAVDLDGTLAEKQEPFNAQTIGPLRKHPGGMNAAEMMQRLKDAGARLIIHTVRGDKGLLENWLKQNSVPFDFINENPDQPEGSSGKIIADLYLDDRAINAEDLANAFFEAFQQAEEAIAAKACDLTAGEIVLVAKGWRDLDRQMKTKGFTGTVTASNGVTYHYVDGKRVSAGEHQQHIEQGNPTSKGPKIGKEQAKDVVETAIADLKTGKKLSADKLADLHNHIQAMDVFDLRAVAKDIGAPIPQNKGALVQAVHDKIGELAGHKTEASISGPLLALSKKLAKPEAMTPEELSGLPTQLAKLNIGEINALKKQMAVAGATKSEIIAKIHEKLTGTPAAEKKDEKNPKESKKPTDAEALAAKNEAFEAIDNALKNGTHTAENVGQLLYPIAKKHGMSITDLSVAFQKFTGMGFASWIDHLAEHYGQEKQQAGSKDKPDEKPKDTKQAAKEAGYAILEAVKKGPIDNADVLNPVAQKFDMTLEQLADAFKEHQGISLADFYDAAVAHEEKKNPPKPAGPDQTTATAALKKFLEAGHHGPDVLPILKGGEQMIANLLSKKTPGITEAQVKQALHEMSAAHPEESKFTGTAHNGVEYVDGVAQKKAEEEKPTETPNAAAPGADKFKVGDKFTLPAGSTISGVKQGKSKQVEVIDQTADGIHITWNDPSGESKSKWITTNEAKQLTAAAAAKTPKKEKPPPAQKTPKSVPTKTDFPDSLDGLQHVANLGGSTGAQMVQDSAGNQFVMKKGASPEHVREESAADNAYKAMGLAVPEVKLYETAGGPVKLATAIPDAVTLKDYLAQNPGKKTEIFQQLRKGFVADALMGNWDVIGASFDNVMVDKHGVAWRIDNGGSLAYRAQGKKKTSNQWKPEVTEIETMRDLYKNPQATQVFDGITDKEIADQVNALYAKKKEILKALPKEAAAMVGKRLDWLKENYGEAGKPMTAATGSIYSGKGKDWKGTPPDPNNTYAPKPKENNNVIFKDYADSDVRAPIRKDQYAPSFKEHMNAVHKAMTPDEMTAAVHYTGSGSSVLNPQMRACPQDLDCLKGHSKEQAAAIDSAIAKAGKFEDPVNVWRNTGLHAHTPAGKKFLAVLQAALETGDDVRIPAVKSTSMSPDRTIGNGNIKLEIKAKSGLWIEPKSHYQSEQELLMGHNTRYRVVAIKDPKDFPDASKWGIHPAKIVQLEEI